jgi:hypothetical protein
MKRALAIAVAVCTLGVAGFSQTITGTWRATVNLIPSVAFVAPNDLTLNYTFGGFVVTSVTGFGLTGLTSQRFGLSGAFGPFTVTGNMWFSVTPPAYTASDLTTSFDFGGIAIGANVRHWMPGGFRGTEWSPDTDLCGAQTPYQGMLYTFTGTIAPVTVRTRFLDCCEGIEFQSLLVTMRGLTLCCGITYNVEFSFTKAGFDYVELSGINIPLCCGVSFDIGVTYRVDSKTLEITPKFAGIGDACFTVWAAPLGDFALPTVSWAGLEIYGFRIRCAIGDCNYLEFINAFNVTEVNKILPAADNFLTAWGEFELVKAGFCGAGCCGGRWTVDLRIFFGTDGGLFDLTRFGYTVAIPIMTNFTLRLSGTMPAISPGPAAAFNIGWTFTF